jgi:1-deoxy-D-xylulose-5-phosphate synthase
MRLPDLFQDQDKPEKQYADAGLDADAIVETVLKAIAHNSSGVVQGPDESAREARA